MFKKIQTIIIALTISLLGSQFAFAVSVDDLVPREGVENYQGTKEYSDIQAVSQLPNLTVEATITSVIKTILGWSIIIAAVALVVAAIYYLIAQGQEDNISKSKDIIVYLIIGLSVMGGAYAIVTGILKFKFFE